MSFRLQVFAGLKGNGKAKSFLITNMNCRKLGNRRCPMILLVDRSSLGSRPHRPAWEAAACSRAVAKRPAREPWIFYKNNFREVIPRIPWRSRRTSWATEASKKGLGFLLLLEAEMAGGSELKKPRSGGSPEEVGEFGLKRRPSNRIRLQCPCQVP